jgi:hypothetical protein
MEMRELSSKKRAAVSAPIPLAPPEITTHWFFGLRMR